MPRTAALIALGAFALHQLRYAIASGGHPGELLAAQGHGYLSDALPVLAAFAVACFAAGMLRALTGHEPGKLTSSRNRTLGFAIALFAVFAFQESMEGILSAGHASGLAAVFAGGGWLAVPLALMVGAVCALLERRMVGIERQVAIVVRARRARRLRPSARAARPRPVVLAPALSPLASGVACRPPPLFALAA